MNKRQLKKKLKKMEYLLEEKQIPGNETRAVALEESEHVERLQRLQAEFENFRKRTQQEKATIAQRARKDILLDFLNLCDSLEEAAQKRKSDEHEEVAAYREGIQLILRQFKDFLEKEGVEEIETEGKPFDPNFHEAMMTEQGDEDQSGQVARELQKGYTYHDEVLRPAKVAVYK